MCVAYGADKKLYIDFVSKGFLPETRAEYCIDEYEQVLDAFEMLIHPHMDLGHVEVQGGKWLEAVR